MNSECSQLSQIWHRRREAIAEQWNSAIAQTGFAPLNTAQVRQRMNELTEQVMAALMVEPFDQDKARAIGRTLASLHYVRPDALALTVQVVADQLVQDLSAEQVVSLQPRLSALLGGLSAGFVQQNVSTLLSEQEQIRGALVGSLQEAQQALRAAYDQVESKVKERTVELATANGQLEQEIVERRRIEAALRESEARYRAISELSSDFAYAYRVDPDGTFEMEWITDAIVRVSGHAQAKVMERGYWENLIHPDDKDLAAQRHQVVLSGRTAAGEMRIMTKDGQTRWLYASSQPVWDPVQERVVRLYGAARDITERKQAEELQRQSDRDLRQIYRMSQALAATLDLRQVLRQLVQAVTDITGAEGSSIWLWAQESASELVCQAAFPLRLEDTLVGLRRSTGQGVVGWVVQNGKSAIVANTLNDARFLPDIDAQTGYRTLSLLATPLRAHDAVLGVLEVVNKLGGEFDAHDQALVETLSGSAAIAIKNAQLVESLRQIAATLKARNEELDTFAHTVAHDLKGPLMNVLGAADLLAEESATLPPEDRQRFTRYIVRNGRKMDNIIDELLLLAGLRNIQVTAGPLDMSGLVAEARQRLTDILVTSQAEIVTPAAWPIAQGYAPWIEEVWVNYISNALKYGGQPPRVELGGEAQPDGRARFWVRDNGPGIAPEDCARLFTPFTRLDQARAKGHGLGLSIVRRIVEKLGGQVGVTSVPGQGSTFSFSLPACPAQLCAPLTSPAASSCH